MIIAIAGCKQSGKSSLTKFFKDMLEDKKVQEISFAYPLKHFIGETFKMKSKHLWGSNDDKNYPLCTWGEIFTEECLKHYNKRSIDLLCAREILQIVGTDVFREGKFDFLNEQYLSSVKSFLQEKTGQEKADFDLWVNLAIQDYKQKLALREIDLAIISDVRFLNEVQAVHSAKGKLIRLHRDTGCSNSIQHASEMMLESLQDSLFDFVLNEEHNKNLQQLKQFAISVLTRLGLINNGGVLV